MRRQQDDILKQMITTMQQRQESEKTQEKEDLKSLKFMIQSTKVEMNLLKTIFTESKLKAISENEVKIKDVEMNLNLLTQRCDLLAQSSDV